MEKITIQLSLEDAKELIGFLDVWNESTCRLARYCLSVCDACMRVGEYYSLAAGIVRDNIYIQKENIQ